MTERDPYNIDWSSQPEAVRVRACADGECSPEEAGLSPDDPRIAHEAGLREACARAMSGDNMQAPAGLREALLASFAHERAAETSTSAPGDQGVVQTVMGDTTDRSFWSGVKSFGAIAAVLALVATVIVVSSNNAFGPGEPVRPFSIQQASDVREFMPRVHGHAITCSPEEFASKFQYTTIDGAMGSISGHLDGLPADFSEQLASFESEGFVFMGLGPCGVPGDGRSAHAIFHAKDDTSRRVSVFIQQLPEASGEMCNKHCFTDACTENEDSSDTLAVWRADGYLHYIYAPNTSDLQSARDTFQAPSRTATLVR